MALELDTSRSFRSLDELTALVRAISRAPATESEPDWLEWKREADLSDRRWQAVIAKCIAGFANRDPAVAKRQADGCAYLVIGVEPGNLGGVSPVDNAMLHSGISRFLGPTVRWSPQYIEHVGKRVLLITVESPAYGDRIVAMLVAYEPQERGTSVCRKGDVFVRRHGSTDRATQEDYNMLARRFATGAEQATGFRIEVMAPVTAVPVTCGPDEVLAWRQEEEQQLLAQFEEDSLHSARSLLSAAGGYRSRDDYRRKVAAYLEDAVPHLSSEAHARAIADRPASMQLVLINDTERNFSAVRAELTIDADVWAYESDATAREVMPERPRTRRIISLAYGYPDQLPTEPPGPRIENSRPTWIAFDDVDLRPGGQVRLDPLHLVADATLAGAAVTAKWAATASNASGVARGEFPIIISRGIVSPLD